MSRRVEEQRRRVLLEHVRAARCTEGDDGAVRSLARGVAVRLGRVVIEVLGVHECETVPVDDTYVGMIRCNVVEDRVICGSRDVEPQLVAPV
jgi:hypothetical protein